MQHKIADRARGRWVEILSGLGMPSALLKPKHGPCPVCGGKDRFRFDDKGGAGTWFCSQSHGTGSDNASGCAGNGFALLMDFKRCDFAEAARLVETIIGTDSVPRTHAPAREGGDEAAAKHRAVVRLWKEARPITKEDPAGLYLQRRLGEFVTSRALRFHHAIPAGTRHLPGMLSAYVDVRGELAGLQRTFLTSDGHKIETRLTMGELPEGGAVRLTMPQAKDRVLGIAEGVETALSASALFGVPVWAALNAGRLELWEPPEGFKDIIIFGDNDAKKVGQKSAYTLAARLERKEIITEVKLPPDVGQDWNDIHMIKRGDRK